MKRILVFTCLAAFSAVSPAAMAADPTPTSLSFDPSQWVTSPTLTGDWGGMRTRLEEKGLKIDISLTQVTQGVLSGGVSHAWQYGGRENITITLDTQKMGLWPGGFLMIEGEGQYGEFVGSGQTGAILPASATALFPTLGSNNFDLPAFMFTQFLSEYVGVCFGKIDTSSGDKNAFAHGKGNDKFLNTAFSLNPVAALTAPYSTLGAGLIFLPTKDPNEFIVTLSVFDSEGRPDTSGVDTVFKGGTTYGIEARYTTHFFGLTGHQTAGVLYSDRAFVSLDQNLANFIIPGLPIQDHSGSFGIMYNFNQYLYQPDPKSDQGWGIFGRIGISDGQANPIHMFFSGGIGGKGIIAGRPNDRFGIGYYYLVVSDHVITDQAGFNDSMGGEIFYEIELTPWLHLTPDFQIIKPSQSDVDCAAVLGVRLEMKF